MRTAARTHANHLRPTPALLLDSFVSPFLRRLPSEARLALCAAVRIESYKKDQVMGSAVGACAGVAGG